MEKALKSSPSLFLNTDCFFPKFGRGDGTIIWIIIRTRKFVKLISS